MNLSLFYLISSFSHLKYCNYLFSNFLKFGLDSGTCLKDGHAQFKMHLMDTQLNRSFEELQCSLSHSLTIFSNQMVFAEGNQVFHHPAGVYPQSFSQDSAGEVVELKSGNEVTNGKHEDLSKSNNFGMDEYWSASGSTCSDHGEDRVVNNLIENRQCERYSSKDSNKIKDKNMMDSDATKVIVCCKDNTTCFEVKDICVDEGVPSNMHISSDKEKDTLTSASEEESINDIAVTGENIAPSSEASKSFEVRREDMTSLNVREDLMEADGGEDEASEAIGDESTGHTACGNSVKGEESLISCSESPKCEEAATYVLMESQDCVVVLGPYDIKNNTMNKQESTETNSALHDEPRNTNLPATEIAENVGVAFNVDAPEISSSFKEVTSKDRSLDNPVKLDKSKADSASNRHMESLEDQHESSFSYTGPFPISGSVTYSGPIAFSGSLSLRSDSSTTSTRSFAFPILQNEWNSSPVKMAKGNRRHLRKHRGWRYGLCCRF